MDFGRCSDIPEAFWIASKKFPIWVWMKQNIMIIIMPNDDTDMLGMLDDDK
jgi:hypothetical protein